jgi:hypothetical protein
MLSSNQFQFPIGQLDLGLGIRIFKMSNHKQIYRVDLQYKEPTRV